MSSAGETKEIDYSLFQLGKKRWLILVFVVFSYQLFTNISILSRIEDNLRKSLRISPMCQIQFDKLDYSLLLPKLYLTDIIVPGSCFQKSSSRIKISRLDLSFRGLSFFPFGPHFKIEANLFDRPLAAYLSVGIFSQVVNISDNIVDLTKLSTLLPMGKVAGEAKINSIIKVKDMKLHQLNLLVESSNLTLPSQNIMAFNIPKLKLNNFVTKIDSNKNGDLLIQEFIIGDTESAIRANFKGKVLKAFNQRNPQLDITGEVAFSEQILEQFAVIKLFMNKFSQKDDFYQLKISGQLSSPRVNSAQ